VVAVQGCLRELKSAAPTLLQWTDTELTVENCVTTNFDRTISRQLEPEWHRLPPATKQLVQDLRTLRTLFQSMISYDCVTFYNLLTNLKTASAQTRHPSLWLLTPAANVLFKNAKARCYTTLKPPLPTVKDPHPVGRLVPVLEVNPKWKLLRHVLEEVESEYRKQQTEQPQGPSVIVGPTTILVMVQDGRTLEAIQSYLSEETTEQPSLEAAGGGKKSKSTKTKPAPATSRTLLLRWLRYLEGINDRSRAKFATTVTAANKGSSEVTGRTVGEIPEEDRLLLEEEGRVRRILFGTGDDSTEQQPQRKGSNMNSAAKRRLKPSAKGAQSSSPVGGPTKLNQVPSHIKKRRRIAQEKRRGESNRDDLEREAVLDDAIEATEHDMGEVQADRPRDSSAPSREAERLAGDDIEKDRDDEGYDDAMFRTSYGNELRIVLRSYASIEGDDASLLLQEVRPRYVVLYDSDMSFIRSIEIYAALREDSEPSPRVYFLMFEASAEEKNFMKSLEREQGAFERLIHHKKTMPPPAIQVHASQEMQEALMQGMGGVEGAYMGGLLPLSVDTRRGRGKLDTTKVRRDVAVDVREFRSALPSILHQGGMRLAPVTLTVGDFVLSNIHCVERKSISDLFGSFASGRLYTQAEAMCKHYKCPCLLIEFDPQKSFSLQSANDLGSEIRTDSICR
jgi:DNA excision repair protein ERCC-4